MEPFRHPNGAVRFGPFEVELELGVLRKHGVKIKLQSQPFQVLAALLENPGSVVTREELRHRLWPDDNFGDFEHGLNAAVTRLRQALGDSAEHPRYVETLSKRGYRFVAPMEQVPPEQGAPQEEARPSARKRVVVVCALSVAAAGFALVGYRFGSNDSPVLLEVVPVTAYPGDEKDPAISPDGAEIAFSWQREHFGDSDVYVKLLHEENAAPIANSPDFEACPAWSPDGLRVAYAKWTQDGKQEIWIAPKIGNGARLVASLPVWKRPDGYFPNTRCLAWHPAGRWLAVSQAQPASDHSDPLFAIDLETGSHRQITAPPGGMRDSEPAFSPDGRQLAFMREEGISADIWLLAVDRNPETAGEPRRLTHTGGAISPTWAVDSRELIVAFGTVGPYWPFLWRVPASGDGAPQRLPLSRSDAWQPVVAARTGQLVYTRLSKHQSIYRLRLSAPGEAAAEPEVCITSSHVNNNPSYSPDGKRIAFESNRSGRHAVWVCDRDGSNPKQLSPKNMMCGIVPRWSHDAKWIVFAEGIGDSRLQIIPADGGVAQPFAADSEHAKLFAQFAPGGLREKALAAGHSDGSNVYYYHAKTSEGGEAIWREPVQGGEPVSVIRPASAMHWCFAKEGIYYVEDYSDGAPIKFFEFGTGKTKTVYRPTKPLGWSLSVAPDGRELLISLVETRHVDLALVEGFR